MVSRWRLSASSWPWTARRISVGVEFIYQGQRVLFSGDVLFENQHTILGADLPKSPLDLLVLETTREASATDASYSRQNELQKLLLQIETIRIVVGPV